MLGLAVSERSIAVAEVATSRGRATLLRTAEFVMPDPGEPRDWTEAGKALRHFLRQNRFSASRCAIGLEAGWLIAKEKVLPPCSSSVVAGIISIAAEREFPSAGEDFVFDYVAAAGNPGERPVLLVAASREKLGGVAAMAKAAGLGVTQVGCSALALAAATDGASPAERLVLYLRGDRAELVVHSPAGVRVLRRLPPPASGRLDEIAGEMRRVVSLLPPVKEPADNRELLVWDESGLDGSAMDVLRERLAMPVRACRFPDDLGLAVRGDVKSDKPLAEAAAIAVQGLSGRMPIVDFMHSRLAQPKKAGPLRRHVAWAAMAAAVIGAAAAAFAMDWRSNQREAASLQGQLDELGGSVRDAREVVDNVSFARDWYDRRPRFLECLREVTLVFPEEGRVWTTGLTVRDGRKALLTGKCDNEREALRVLDRLKAGRGFSNVKPLYIRQAGGNTREVAFAVSFDFAGAK